jgi:two-component system, LytTR family, response regulator LytT
MKINIAIIEDEPATARSLKNLLQEADPEIEIIAVLAGVATSIEWLQNNNQKCDLFFMDIRLNDGLSFEIFEKITPDAPVIFVTAYNEYALKAFKKNGIDYILKPFDEEEVLQSLEKFKKLKQSSKPAPDADLQSILQEIKMQSAYKKSFLVHYRDKLIPLSAANIQWFQSVNETVHTVTTDNKFYVVDGTLEKLQQELDPSQFFRANRQFIINRAAINEVDFFFNGRLLVKVNPASKENILISKARVPEFKLWMNQ